MKRFLALLTLVLLTTALAVAQQKTSRWRSSSGATITVTTHEQWVSVDVKPVNGQPRRWQGKWLRKYDLFDYDVSGVTYTAHLVGNQIQVSSANGEKFVWTQLGSAQSQPAASASNYPYAQAVTARWASSSGNIFDVRSSGAQVHLSAFLTDGRTLKTTGTWLNQVSFRYQFPGFNEVATCTYLRDGRLKVDVSGKNTTYWTKVK